MRSTRRTNTLQRSALNWQRHSLCPDFEAWITLESNTYNFALDKSALSFANLWVAWTSKFVFMTKRFNSFHHISLPRRGYVWRDSNLHPRVKRELQVANVVLHSFKWLLQLHIKTFYIILRIRLEDVIRDVLMTDWLENFHLVNYLDRIYSRMLLIRKFWLKIVFLNLKPTDRCW